MQEIARGYVCWSVDGEINISGKVERDREERSFPQSFIYVQKVHRRTTAKWEGYVQEIFFVTLQFY